MSYIALNLYADAINMDDATFSNLYVAKSVQASGTATILTSGCVEFCTSNTPTMKHGGILINTGRVENGVACFDFANLQIGPNVSVVLTGDRPLLLASMNDMYIDTPFIVSAGTLGGGLAQKEQVAVPVEMVVEVAPLPEEAQVVLVAVRGLRDLLAVSIVRIKVT